MVTTATIHHRNFGDTRLAVENGDLYVCRNDIAAAMGCAGFRKTFPRHCLDRHIELKMENGRYMQFVTAADAFRIIGASRGAEAKDYGAWLFAEAFAWALRDAGPEKPVGSLGPEGRDEVEECLVDLLRRMARHGATDKEADAVIAVVRLVRDGRMKDGR